jgi:hypothetical protein
LIAGNAHDSDRIWIVRKRSLSFLTAEGWIVDGPPWEATYDKARSERALIWACAEEEGELKTAEMGKDRPEEQPFPKLKPCPYLITLS